MIFFNSGKSSKLYQLCLNDLWDRVPRQTADLLVNCVNKGLTKIATEHQLLKV
jgi:hypothetical protein